MTPLTEILRTFLVPDRVFFKLAVTVHQCLNGRAPPYLSEHCIPVSGADTRRHLRSANRHLLAVPRFRLNTYGRRAFSVAGPMAYNSLPDPTSSIDCSRLLPKTCLFARHWCISALGVVNDYARVTAESCDMYRYTVMYEILMLTKQRKASVLQGLYRALKTEDWLKRLGL